jgi:hypothetical protein
MAGGQADQDGEHKSADHAGNPGFRGRWQRDDRKSFHALGLRIHTEKKRTLPWARKQKAE